MRRACWAAAALALLVSPAAEAGRTVSVGYSTPAALRGLAVSARIAPLRVAVVDLPDTSAVRHLRTRPGIRFVHRLVARRRDGGPALPGSSLAVPAWQWTAAHENSVPAWVQHAAAAIRIAVVDTGADVAVPSLAAKPLVTWDAATSTAAVHDDVGHGTFVASLAAGAGLGFGGDAQLLIVQANRGGPSFSDVDEANAIVWAVDHGANIVNLSLGGSQTSPVERDAVDYAIAKGVLLVAAAGNEALEGDPAVYPAALIGRAGLVVGAADATGHRAAFSSTGAYVDLLAPGVGVLGALAPGVGAGLFTPVATPGADGAYGAGSGTSYAAPEAAGAAALVWAAAPSIGAARVAQTLEATASGDGRWSRDAAFGELDVAAAVRRALAGWAPRIVLRPPQLAKVAGRRSAPERPR
jgi:subtilisin family serine protease